MKNNINLLREQKKLTQQECADIFGVKLRTWQTYEQGISEPKFETLFRIADYFNTSLDYLLGRELLSNDDEFIRIYKELPEQTKQIFIDTIAKLAEASHKRSD